MAFGRNSRMDRRSSSSYCSTATLVVFVALCLVGVWMMTSSSFIPLDMSDSQNKSDVKENAIDNGKRFEDGSDDVTKDSTNEQKTKLDSMVVENANPEGQNSPELTTESKEQETQEDNAAKGSEDGKNGSEELDRGQTYSDENGKIGDGERNSDELEDGHDKVSELNETTKNKQQQNDEEKKPNAQTSEDEKVQEKIEETLEQTQIKSQEKLEETVKPTQEKGQEKLEETVEPTQDKGQEKLEETVEQAQGKGQEKLEETLEQTQTVEKNKTDEMKIKDPNSNQVFPDPAQSELLNETNTQPGSWSTQATESKKEKEAQQTSNGQIVGYSWKLCNVSSGADYIPCLDNTETIKKLHSTKHYEHRERHCPQENPTCLVPLPEGYKRPVKWPKSRDKIWYANVPHTKLAVVKGHQNWVKVTGEYLTFPGGGTQFKHGALHYIDFIQESLPDIAWGNRTRVILDVGCGVASFGGFLFERDVLAMSFAPKDEHEAQVQFALERGIPAISAVMGTKRLPFPSRVFDVVHCARCRVPWHIEGGMLLLELNRLLRPGGYFVWSATPVYQKLTEDVEIWKEMAQLTKSICWEMVSMTKDALNEVGIAIYRKPSTNDCYDQRVENDPPLCKSSDDPNAAWNVPLQACIHRVPVDTRVHGSQWPEQWPKRSELPPHWMNSSQLGVYGRPAPEDFKVDYEHWKHVVSKSYLSGMGINWSIVRNVMDMRSIYGGFAAALRDMKVWVMNVVSIDSADTLPIIYERGLFGIYHDWCESFSSYPRTYDLLHADHLFSRIKKRCKPLSIMAEVDRLLRPEGKLIVRDNLETINMVENIARSLQWEVRMTYSKEKEGLLCVQKTMWRPKEVDASV